MGDRMRVVAVMGLVCSLGCGEKSRSPDDGADLDIDTDVDTDVDTDTDADTDTDDPECPLDLVLGGGFVAGCWSVESLGPGRRAHEVQLAIDSTGAAHAVYVESEGDIVELRYVTNAGGEWAKESLDCQETNSFTTGASLALDASDGVHVTFPGLTDGRLHYATRPDAEWRFELIDLDIHWLDIDVAPDGTIHGAYHLQDEVEEVEELAHTTYDAGEWTSESVDGPGKTGRYPSVAVDGAGAVHIVYVDVCPTWDDTPCVRDEDFPDFRNLNYATNESGDWVIETIAPDARHWTALAVEADGTAHIAYSNDVGPVYGTNASGEWVVETVTEDTPMVRWGPSITADSDGFAHLCYSSSNYYYVGPLRYATNRGGGWSIEEVVDMDGTMLEYCSIDLDADRVPHIAYALRTDEEGTVRYAVRDCPEGE